MEPAEVCSINRFRPPRFPPSPCQGQGQRSGEMAQARLYLQRDLTVHVNALSQDLVRHGVRPHRRLFLLSSGGQEEEKKKEKETSLDYYQVFLRCSLVLSTLTSEKPLRAKCLENILSGGGIDTKLAPFNTEYRFFFFFPFYLTSS